MILDLLPYLGVAIIEFTVIALFLYIGRKSYFAINFYYFGRFVLRFFMHDVQVRYQVVASILLISFCLLAAFVVVKNKKFHSYNVPCLRGIIIVILAVVPIEVLWGFINGYQIFQIAVDVYKVLEIIIFFVLIKYTWQNTWEAEQSIKLLVLEMCVFGMVEIFTTQRGGTGLNMIMSVFPLYYATGFVRKSKSFWWVCVIAIIVVMLSQTRTYIIAMLFGLIVIGYVAHGVLKRIIIQKTLLIGTTSLLIFLILGLLFHSDAVNAVISRFTELFNEGFEGAGGYRIYEIRQALNKFSESPIFGQGYGYLEYLYIELMGYFNWGDFMHNTYVEILCKTGIYGSVIYGIGIILYVRSLYQLKVKSELFDDKMPTSLLAGGIGGTICWLVVYSAAPLSSYGYIFLPGIMSLVYYSLYRKESENMLGATSAI